MNSLIAAWPELIGRGAMAKPTELRFHSALELNQFCARAGLVPPRSPVGACLGGMRIGIDPAIAPGHITLIPGGG